MSPPEEEVHDPTCAACEEPIDDTVLKCPSCGNKPRNEILAGLVGCSILAAILYVVVPVAGLLMLPVLGLLGVSLVLLDHSPTRTRSLV